MGQRRKGNTGQQTSRGQTPVPTAGKRKKRAVLEVDPQDRRIEKPPLLERLKSEARIGLPGLLGSFVLHVLLLIVLAVIAVRTEQSSAPQAFEVGWITRQEQEQKTTSRPKGPVKLEAFEFTPEQQPDPEPEPEAEQSEPDKPRPRVRLRSPAVPKNRASKRAEGDERIRQALSAGLDWLARQQQSTGHWRLHEGYPDAGSYVLRTDTGATALALLAYLGAGHTHRDGPYREEVRQGLRWLRGVQKPNGDFHDHTELGRQTAFYAHSQAVIALCEAYALTGDETLREPAERGVRYLLESQHPVRGGWKYRPQTADSESDLSVTGWALTALHLARTAGIDVPRDAFERATTFLDAVQEKNGARYKYRPTYPADRVTPAMTAEGLLCRQLLGWPADYPPLQSGVDYLLRDEHRPEWSAGRRNVYAWYYTGHVLHNRGGEAWRRWYARVKQEIVENQTRRGGLDRRGSWNPTDPPGAEYEYGAKAGRLYVTSLCLLILELPYRYQPLAAE